MDCGGNGRRIKGILLYVLCMYYISEIPESSSLRSLYKLIKLHVRPLAVSFSRRNTAEMVFHDKIKEKNMLDTGSRRKNEVRGL